MTRSRVKYVLERGILKNNYLMVSGHLFITDENKREVLPLYNEELGLILVSDAILDNREELIEIFNKDKYKINNSITDSELILMSYEKWGEDCPKYLLGDFNIIVTKFNEKYGIISIVNRLCLFI